VLGLFLLGATVLALAAGAWQLGLVPTTSDSLQFLLLTTIATYLTIGLCYAHIRSRLTGQIQSRILSEPEQVQEPQEPLVG
jgi:membrane protein implicated in regulation of membrane protease activity